MRFVLLLFGLILCSHGAESTNRALFNLTDVVPIGRCELEVMAVRMSDRATQLDLKLQSAVATNQDWLLDHIKKAKPGEPLDYDPKLGLTKDEYGEYLRETEKRQLASTGTKLPCRLTRNGDSISINLEDANSPLSKMQLNAKTGDLVASGIKIGKPMWRSSDDLTTPLGPYDGCSWEYEKSNLDTFDVRIVRLDIWRLKPSGKVIWRFKDAEMVRKKNTLSFELVFQLLPQTASESGPRNGGRLSPPVTNQPSAVIGPSR